MHKFTVSEYAGDRRANELIRNLGDIAGRFDISETEARRIAERATTEAEFIAIWENEDYWADENN